MVFLSHRSKMGTPRYVYPMYTHKNTHAKFRMVGTDVLLKDLLCKEKEKKILEHNKALEMMLARLIWGLPRATENKQDRKSVV